MQKKVSAHIKAKNIRKDSVSTGLDRAAKRAPSKTACYRRRRTWTGPSKTGLLACLKTIRELQKGKRSSSSDANVCIAGFYASVLALMIYMSPIILAVIVR